jgi:hypothetical protein
MFALLNKNRKNGFFRAERKRKSRIKRADSSYSKKDIAKIRQKRIVNPQNCQ